MTPNSNTGVSWRVVSPSVPVLWPWNDNETWLLNPPLRYITTSDRQVQLEDKLASWSNLKTAGFYHQLNGMANINNSRILIERHRDRGIGDLLFVTGAIAYLRHISSHTCEIYYYTQCDRGLVLHGNPDLHTEKTFSGIVQYDSLPLYQWHWFIEAATEYDEEPEQSNVYDCLFKQIGINPEGVDPKFKRPRCYVYKSDKQRADDFFRLLFYERQEDWRKQPYWIIAPTTMSSLRSAPYSMWLNLIQELAEKQNKKVIVVGQAGNNIMPETDMPFTEFMRHLGNLASHHKNVVNLIGKTPIRLIMGLLASAEGLVTLDSGLLYVAEGLRTPAVSIWGPHHPWVRIGYDSEYMDLAIHEKTACSSAPCFAYRKFPAHKCPRKETQEICEPLAAVRVDDVIGKMQKVWDRGNKDRETVKFHSKSQHKLQDSK